MTSEEFDKPTIELEDLNTLIAQKSRIFSNGENVSIEIKGQENSNYIHMRLIIHRDNEDNLYRIRNKFEEFYRLLDKPPFKERVFNLDKSDDYPFSRDIPQTAPNHIKLENIKIKIPNQHDSAPITLLGIAGYELCLENVNFVGYEVSDSSNRETSNFFIDETHYLTIKGCRFEKMPSLKVSLICRPNHRSDTVKNYESIKMEDCVLENTDFGLYISLISYGEKGNTYEVSLSNNKIQRLTIDSDIEYDLHFNGNEVRHINISGKHRMPRNVDWGLYEKVDVLKNSDEYRAKPDGNKKLIGLIDETRRTLNQFKQRAEDNGDHVGKGALNYHATICDEALIELKNKSLQDRWIMIAGKWLSNHGKSWIRPVLCLATINILISQFVLAELQTICYNNKIAFSYIYWELLNPLSNLNTFSKGEISPVLSFLTALSKLVYGVCGYEFVRVVRRFTRK